MLLTGWALFLCTKVATKKAIPTISSTANRHASTLVPVRLVVDFSSVFIKEFSLLLIKIFTDTVSIKQNKGKACN